MSDNDIELTDEQKARIRELVWNPEGELSHLVASALVAGTEAGRDFIQQGYGESPGELGVWEALKKGNPELHQYMTIVLETSEVALNYIDSLIQAPEGTI